MQADSGLRCEGLYHIMTIPNSTVSFILVIYDSRKGKTIWESTSPKNYSASARYTGTRTISGNSPELG